MSKEFNSEYEQKMGLLIAGLFKSGAEQFFENLKPAPNIFQKKMMIAYASEALLTDYRTRERGA